MGNLVKESTESQFDFSAFANGSYLVNVYTEDTFFPLKLTKQ